MSIGDWLGPVGMDVGWLQVKCLHTCVCALGWLHVGLMGFSDLSEHPWWMEDTGHALRIEQIVLVVSWDPGGEVEGGDDGTGEKS